MYLLPECYLCEKLQQFLAQTCALDQVQECTLPHASVGQPRHRLAVFRKRG
jgi:hypothetical protein